MLFHFEVYQRDLIAYSLAVVNAREEPRTLYRASLDSSTMTEESLGVGTASAEPPAVVPADLSDQLSSPQRLERDRALSRLEADLGLFGVDQSLL